MRSASIPLLVLVALLAGCGSSVHYVVPWDYQNPFRRDSTIAYYGKALNGVTVFLDPGHGGDERGAKGYSGDIDEAKLNLGIALMVRDLLKKAGANVILSRDNDRTVPLAARAQQANANRADLFVSIHHNATTDNITNYTSTFYHSTPGKPGYQPSSRDLARYIQRDLAYVQGIPGPLASFDGTLSDLIIAKQQGFAVLREAAMTAVLVECSFLSSEYEEKRLKLREYNELQAWGIFRGIAKYLKAGIPTLAYASPLVFHDRRPRIELIATDATGIDDESIRVYVNGKEEGFSFNTRTGKIMVQPSEELSSGYHLITAQVRNTNENSSAPFSVFFAVGTPPAALRTEVVPPALPPDPRAFSIVTVTAVDTAGFPCQDGLPIRFRTDTGIDTILPLRKGAISMHLESKSAGRIAFTASNGPVRTEGVITIDSAAQYSRGLVVGSDGKPVANAALQLPGGAAVSANANGEYIIAGRRIGGVEVTVAAPGYFGQREALAETLVQDPIILGPVARGVLRGKRFVLELIDPRGNAKAPPAIPLRFDERMMAGLEKLLTASGAECVVLSGTSTKSRYAGYIEQPGTTLIQIGLDPATVRTQVKFGSDAESKTLGERITKAVASKTSLKSKPLFARALYRNEYGKARHLQYFAPPPGPQSYPEQQTAFHAWNAVWMVYAGILDAAGYKAQGSRNVEVTVVAKADSRPAPYVEVILNHALRTMTDAKGIARFEAVTITEDDVQLAEPESYQINGVKTEIVH